MKKFFILLSLIVIMIIGVILGNYGIFNVLEYVSGLSWYFLIILILLSIYMVALYNHLVVLRNNVKKVFANMDIYLKKRWSVVNNLVKLVKEYMNYEEDTLKEVIALRNSTYNSTSDDERIKIDQQLSKKIDKIMIACERYPDLKANEQFKELTINLAKIEDEIGKSIEDYNEAVVQFNNVVESLPEKFFVKLLGFEPKPMFEISQIEKSSIDINFNQNK